MHPDQCRSDSLKKRKYFTFMDFTTPDTPDTAADAAHNGINISLLLKAASLTPTLKARFSAADVNGDGILSADELINVFESEIKARRDRMLFQRLLIALGAACILIVAAVVGLTYGVVSMSKDTTVDGALFVNKESNVPLATSNLQYHASLPELYKEESAIMLQSLEQVVVPFGDDGTMAVLRVAGIKLKPGVMVEIDTFQDDVSIIVNETGVIVLGAPPSAGGKRRLLVDNKSIGHASFAVSPQSHARLKPRPGSEPLPCALDDWACKCRNLGSSCECPYDFAQGDGWSCVCYSLDQYRAYCYKIYSADVAADI